MRGERPDFRSAANEARDWSKATVESTMKRYPAANDLGSWGYAKSLYLYGQYLVWKRTGDGKYLQYMNDPKTGLMFHAYDESGASKWADPATHHSAEFWCRAMGWFGMTVIEVLEILPRNHPRRPQLISQVRQLVKAWAQFQDQKTGLWYQVVDKGNVPDNWLETSSSSMYTYVTSMAVKRAYISSSYQKGALQGYQGVLSRISLGADGLTNITDICEGTNVADLAYYLARKRNANDFHGLGAFLIMNEHMTAVAAHRKIQPVL
jgi:unsaturated rhamnogalacturonyl hydrolase